MQRLGGWSGVAAAVVVLCVAGCKSKLHTFTVEERISADAHKPGRLPDEALHCQVVHGGAFAVQVKELRDDYTGVVHIRADGLRRCDDDFSFRMERDEHPPGGGTKRRYSDSDIAYWNLVELRPLAK